MEASVHFTSLILSGFLAHGWRLNSARRRMAPHLVHASGSSVLQCERDLTLGSQVAGSILRRFLKNFSLQD